MNDRACDCIKEGDEVASGGKGEQGKKNMEIKKGIKQMTSIYLVSILTYLLTYVRS
jgi:hypothetical protein